MTDFLSLRSHSVQPGRHRLHHPQRVSRAATPAYSTAGRLRRASVRSQPVAAASDSHRVSDMAIAKTSTTRGSPGRSAAASPRQTPVRRTEPRRRPPSCSLSSCRHGAAPLEIEPAPDRPVRLLRRGDAPSVLDEVVATVPTRQPSGPRSRDPPLAGWEVASAPSCGRSDGGHFGPHGRPTSVPPRSGSLSPMDATRSGRVSSPGVGRHFILSPQTNPAARRQVLLGPLPSSGGRSRSASRWSSTVRVVARCAWSMPVRVRRKTSRSRPASCSALAAETVGEQHGDGAPGARPSSSTIRSPRGRRLVGRTPASVPTRCSSGPRTPTRPVGRRSRG